ncbi:MAG TPA: C40 family peptidase [Pyrinomonadaceae bacterium]|nr:C40 family peptidase [Pyrinomonadaceae bacterium]
MKKLFPYALAACFALVLPFSVAAQKGESHVRLVVKTYEAPRPVAKSADPVIISLASPEEIKASEPATVKGVGTLQFRDLMTSLIDQRLGARYSWGATGPYAFDCSGFVWSTFKSAGIDFERGSARNLWSRFAAPAPEEQYKFGTLVFFSNLAHVGIVVDEHGFYHASRRHGVVYSPFNDYWLSRVDGFRKVPVPLAATTTD